MRRILTFILLATLIFPGAALAEVNEMEKTIMNYCMDWEIGTLALCACLVNSASMTLSFSEYMRLHELAVENAPMEEASSLLEKAVNDRVEACVMQMDEGRADGISTTLVPESNLRAMEGAFAAGQSELTLAYASYLMEGGPISDWNYDQEQVVGDYTVRLIGQCGPNASSVEVLSGPVELTPENFPPGTEFTKSFDLCE